MKRILIAGCFLIFYTSVTMAFSKLPLVAHIKSGCGLSDLVYQNISMQVPEKSSSKFAISSKGPETIRNLFFYTDHSWFLTLEFYSALDVAQDVTCVVARGTGLQSQAAIDYQLKNYPLWKWGSPPAGWPRTKP